jgi:hypothetical protein
MASPAPEAPHVVGTVPGLEEAVEKRKKPAPAPWERPLKQALAVVVIGCGAALPLLSPTSDALAFKVCSWVLAVGAGLGITSSGNPPKK